MTILRREEEGMRDEQGLKKQAKDLEETFFARENERLLRELSQVEEKRKALQGCRECRTDDHRHLLDLGVGPESILASGSFPWLRFLGDGRPGRQGTEAILKAPPNVAWRPAAPTTPCWSSGSRRSPAGS